MGGRTSIAAGTTSPHGAAGALLLTALLGMIQTPAPADLEVSESGHFFSYKGKTISLVGDSGTQCVMQNPNIDYQRWLDDCAEAGLNCVHIWSFVAPRQQLDGSDVEERYGYVYPGITPWPRKDNGPHAMDGGFQWDLQRFDEGEGPTHYWPRLRDLCRRAERRDILAGITVFWGWPKHPDDWAYHPFNVRNGGPVEDTPRPQASQVQMTHSPGQEVWKESWSNAWPPEKKTQWLWEQFAIKLLDETSSFRNVFFVFMDEHSYSEGNGGDHFLRFFQQRGALWVDWERRRDMVDAVFEPVNFNDRTGKNGGVVVAFRREPARPFMVLEGGPYQGEDVRLSIWSVLMGGGHHVFHDDAGMETVHTGIMGYDPNVPGSDTGATRRAWMGHASRFFNGAIKHLDAMTPRNDLTGEDAFCLAAPGEEYVVYRTAQGTGRVTLDLSDAPGTYRCRFYDPRTGQWREPFTIEGGATQRIAAPDAGDWVLHATATGG